MATQPTIKEMQDAILTIEKFARLDDYNLCRDYQKNLIISMAQVLNAIISARDWVPVNGDKEEL